MDTKKYYEIRSITIEITCPQIPDLSRNRKRGNGKENYLCKDRECPFIGDHELTYQGGHSWIVSLVKIMVIRGIGHQWRS
jgi:hypothetical protein